MKTWNSIKWDIEWWMRNRSPLYINAVSLRRCYDEWRPWSKFFKKPQWKYWGHWRSNFNIFRLQVEELWGKSKYGEPRHEEDPSVTLSFLWWSWKWYLGVKNGIESMIYWETVLWMYDLRKKYDNDSELVWNAINENTWSDRKNGEMTAVDMLTGYGKHLYDTWSHHLKCKSTSVPANGDLTMPDNDSEQ